MRGVLTVAIQYSRVVREIIAKTDLSACPATSNAFTDIENRVIRAFKKEKFYPVRNILSHF